jgi:hypothetical protein
VTAPAAAAGDTTVVVVDDDGDDGATGGRGGGSVSSRSDGAYAPIPNYFAETKKARIYSKNTCEDSFQPKSYYFSLNDGVAGIVAMEELLLALT